MGALQIVFGALLIVLAIVVILIVMMQEGHESNMGVISGAADNFFDKGKARTLNAFLAKWTKWIAIIFFVLVLATMLICNL